jgi:HlyD family secretion protein
MKSIKLVTFFLFLIYIGATIPGCSIMLEDSGNKNALQASGVVEAVEIVLAPEIGGRVANVYVNEGDQVDNGEILFTIEDKLLISQLNQTEAAYNIALANYNLTTAGQTGEQKKAAIASAEYEVVAAKFDLKNLYKDTDLLAAQALESAAQLEKELNNLQNPDLKEALAVKAIADAKKTIESAERRLQSVSSAATDADIAAAEAQVVLARDALNDAKDDFKPYENKPEDNLQRANYQSKLAAAQQVYDAAVRKLNALQGTGSKADIAVAEADLTTAKAQLLDAEREWERIKNGPAESEVELLKAQIAKAYRDYEIYKNGPNPDDVVLAEARVANAEAQLELAKAEFPTQEEVDVAQAQLDAAKANMEAVQVQIELLAVKAPINGVVMTRNIEPGEVIQPGLAAITISQLDKLTITVYIPEDKYGQINLGDHATLVVDSFPDENFGATVSRIADQAEYTPRNVQTKEDRQTTVYAIQLLVTDLENKLKPGRPTDVIFDTK